MSFDPMDDAESPSLRPLTKDGRSRTEGFSERVMMLAQNVGGIMELAKRADLSHQVVRKYVRGVSDPSRQRLVALARAGEVRLEWLATGEGGMRADEHGRDGEKPQGPAQGDLVPVPLIGTSHLDTGCTVHPSGQPPDGEPALIYLDMKHMPDLPGLQASQLAIHVMRGDSMEPTIPANTPVLIDRSEDGARPADDVFVFCLEGRVLMKRLQWLPGRRLRIRSDNPTYEGYDIDLSVDQPFLLIGRVLYALRLV
ncbi:MAG: S24 family peptidase [Oceanibaculum nanhaiense]|uniref:S24 family peptidase n=1 Tax=Oceanibaculum nanhaiense TaxID=1909734 RepID=UPI0032EF6F2B